MTIYVSSRKYERNVRRWQLNYPEMLTRSWIYPGYTLRSHCMDALNSSLNYWINQIFKRMIICFVIKQ